MDIKYSKAQGAIEYLVLLAIVIVVSLVLVALLISSSQPSISSVSQNNSQLGDITSGGITITDVVADVSGNGLISLSNNTDGVVTLNRIVTGENQTLFNEQLVNGDRKFFSLTDMGVSCPCSAGESYHNCEFTFVYTTADGLVKSVKKTLAVECVSAVISNNENVVQHYTESDTNAPIVLLESPQNNFTTGSSSVDFNFYVSDNNSISACYLDINGSSFAALLSVTNNSYNTITYSSFSGGGYVWDINCGDTSGNFALSGSSRNFTYNNPLGFDSCWSDSVSPHTLCNCLDLNAVRNHLDWNYVLQSDIDCSDTINWNGGAGFTPIGTLSSAFVGSLDGESNAISNLFISSSSAYSGLFGYSSGSSFSNISFTDANVNSTADYLGVLSGYATGDINNIFVTGILNGKRYTGGVIGWMAGQSSDISFSGNVVGTDEVGGLFGKGIKSISRASATGTIIGNGKVGGLVGYFRPTGPYYSNTQTISRVSFDGNITGFYAGGIAGTFDGYDAYGSTNIVNCYTKGIYSGSSAAGGIGGTVNAFLSVDKCYSTAQISGATWLMGGLLGGLDWSSVSNSFFAGTLGSASGLKGSIAGRIYSSSNPTNAFFDVNRAGVGYNCCSSASCTCSNVSDTNAGYATYWYTSSNSPLSSWDFTTIWQANAGAYPTLR